MDFDDLLVRTVNLLELFEDVRERYRRAFRWVLVDEYQDTNRAQYRLLQLLASEHRNLFVVGDDDQSIYALPGRRHPQHPRVRARLRRTPRSSSSSRTTARRRRSSTPPTRSIANNTERPASASGPGSGRGEPVTIAELDDEHAEARYVAVGDRAARERGGDPARRDRGLLPGQRAEPRARGHAGALRDPLPGDRRHQVLRARRDQGRGRLPQPAREPGRRGVVRADRQLAAPRDRRAPPRRGCSSHANTTGQDIWDVFSRAGARPRPRRRGAEGRAPVRRARCAACASGADSADDRPPVAELLEAVLNESGYLEALEAERTIEAEGRVENLEELVGVAGEFDANREVEGESDVGPLEEFLAQISLYTDQDSLQDRREPVHADDPPQREGPRVRRGVHDRLRGGGLPAHALDRGGQPRGGAAPLLRRRHPRASSAST